MVNKKLCSITIDDRIFHREAILKTAYLFTDRFFLHLSYVDEHHIVVTLEAKPLQEMEEMDKVFSNELLSQMLRYHIAKQEKNIKELILGRALFSTCIGTEDSIDSIEDDEFVHYTLDDIAISWFEVNSDESNHPVR